MPVAWSFANMRETLLGKVNDPIPDIVKIRLEIRFFFSRLDVKPSSLWQWKSDARPSETIIVATGLKCSMKLRMTSYGQPETHVKTLRMYIRSRRIANSSQPHDSLIENNWRVECNNRAEIEKCSFKKRTRVTESFFIFIHILTRDVISAMDFPLK